MSVLEYDEADFTETSDTWKNEEFTLSQFDKQLRSGWDKALADGRFRYELEIEDTNIIGERQYIAQLNIKRATERRKPDDINTLQQPYNPAAFNFTKISQGEILFEMKKKTSNSSTENCTDQKQGRNMVIINVSPLEYGHVLLVPDIDGSRPQVLSKDAIQWSIETMLLSHHRGFRIGFNSLCAFASVNHQHLHAYYLDRELYTESVAVEPIHGCLYALTDTPAKGFAFQLYKSSPDIISSLNQPKEIAIVHMTQNRSLGHWVFAVTNYLQTHEIAHNLYMTRGPAFGCDRNNTDRTVRIYVWPRKKATGLKDVAAFNVALVELAGHLPVKNREMFYDLDERKIEDEIRSFGCDMEEYAQIRREVTKLVQTLFTNI